jgi:RimJ/RimL family protein N-acetyltransferase
MLPTDPSSQAGAGFGDGATMASPELFTDRLRINDLAPGDAAALHAYRSHEDVARFQDWIPASLDDALAFITRNAATPFSQAHSWYQLAVRLRATDELIGDLGVHFVADDGHQVELGVSISPAHQRRGLATEALVATLGYLFTILHKHRVLTSIDPRNDASIALVEKVGMRREAHFRQSLFWKGEWVDDVVYAMLAAEWKVPAPSRRRR